MSELIQKEFEEWTKGLDPKEARIAVFEKIRDIPYHLSFDKSPERPLKELRGDCGSKNRLLEQFFKLLGLKTRHLAVRFDWKDVPGIPKEILSLLESSLGTSAWHLALEVFIEGKWRVVDATWDRGLERTGLPVVGKWDGVSSMEMAVKPLRTYRTSDIEKFLKERLGSEKRDKKRDEKETQAFFDAFNKWLEELRG